jgi:hypothetical protein
MAFCSVYLRLTRFVPEQVHLLLESVGITQAIVTLPVFFSSVRKDIRDMLRQSRTHQDLIGSNILESNQHFADALKRQTLSVSLRAAMLPSASERWMMLILSEMILKKSEKESK